MQRYRAFQYDDRFRLLAGLHEVDRAIVLRCTTREAQETFLR